MSPIHQEVSLPTRVLGSAPRLLEEGAHWMEAELWASHWLGRAWTERPGETEPETWLCLQVAGRVAGKPTPSGAAAAVALRRLAPPSVVPSLDDAVDAARAAHVSLPDYVDLAPAAPTAAWRCTDDWDAERHLLVAYDAVDPQHTLEAAVDTVGKPRVTAVDLVDGSVLEHYLSVRGPDNRRLRVFTVDPDEILAELAVMLRAADGSWPRERHESFVQIRALAWARCRHLLPPPDVAPAPTVATGAPHLRDGPGREELAAEFGRRVRGRGLRTYDPTVVDRLVELCLDYGYAHLHAGPLAWSPDHVKVFMTEWLPERVVLDAAQREALPAVLRQWIRFALRRRGLTPWWIDPVTDRIAIHLEAFHEAMDAAAAAASAASAAPPQRVVVPFTTRSGPRHRPS